MSGVVAATITGGAALVSGYMGARAVSDAADTSAAASRYGADLQMQQYQQSRQDLSPYREVAVGRLTGSDFNESAYETELARYQQDADNLRGSFGVSRVARQQEAAAINALGAAPTRQDYETPTYTGGALQELSRYGESRVDPNQYIPQGQVQRFDSASTPPEYNPNIDITQDPSYQFRKDEMLRGIDRTSAGIGKLLSGNRLEEIMQRSGDMASQEYQAAYGRNVQDYGIQRQGEADRYGRDVDRYKFGVASDEMQYGRDVDRYTRDYSQEIDYLNRMANLANVGQTATNTTIQAGHSSATNAANLISAAGDAQAASTIGQANAWSGAIGGAAEAYGRYTGYNSPPSTYSPQGSRYTYNM